MKLTTFGLFFLLLAAIYISGCRKSDFRKTENQVSVRDTSENRLDWFREAKFGMFIHWGPYSCLEGEYNGCQVPVGQNAEWIMKNLTIPVNEYHEIARKMNPVRFDAKEWVRLAKETGMKYIVLTAKHH
ncbi:MAG: glycoside hydrolase family 29 (alpha-L-fucosidase), partial [Bacteroidetes bacterium]|nr:glycoside hydrolase family 29 (alpha-L-fucosidase) [Bacteroidota bacterium]